MTLSETQIEDTMNRCSRKDLDRETVVYAHKARDVVMESRARSTAQTRDSAAMIVPPSRCTNVSMDLSPKLLQVQLIRKRCDGAHTPHRHVEIPLTSRAARVFTPTED